MAKKTPKIDIKLENNTKESFMAKTPYSSATLKMIKKRKEKQNKTNQS